MSAVLTLRFQLPTKAPVEDHVSNFPTAGEPNKASLWNTP